MSLDQIGRIPEGIHDIALSLYARAKLILITRTTAGNISDLHKSWGKKERKQEQ